MQWRQLWSIELNMARNLEQDVSSKVQREKDGCNLSECSENLKREMLYLTSYTVKNRLSLRRHANGRIGKRRKTIERLSD